MSLTFRQGATAIGLALAALASFGFGWWQDNASNRPVAAAADVDWADYKPAASDLLANAKILADKQPFGPPAAAPGLTAAAPGLAGASGTANGTGAARPDQWRVGAIVTAETNRYLVLLLRRSGETADRTEMRRIGESLPDGGVIHTLGPDDFTVDLQGKTRTIKMFSQK